MQVKALKRGEGIVVGGVAHYGIESSFKIRSRTPSSTIRPFQYQPPHDPSPLPQSRPLPFSPADSRLLDRMDDPPPLGDDGGPGAVTEESFEIDASHLVDYHDNPALDSSLNEPMEFDEAAYEHEDVSEGAEDPFMTSPEALNALAAAVLAQNEASEDDHAPEQDTYANGESSAAQDWTEAEAEPVTLPSITPIEAGSSAVTGPRAPLLETTGLPPYTAPRNVIYPTDSFPDPYVGSMDLQPAFSNVPSNSLFRPAYLPDDVDPRVDQRSVWMGVDRASCKSPPFDTESRMIQKC